MSIAADLNDGFFNVERREIALWSGAAAVVVAIHVIAWDYYNDHRQPADMPPSEAASAVMIELAPMAVAPEAVPTEVAELVDSVSAEPVEEPVEMAEPVPEPEPVVDEVVETTEPVTEPEVVPEMTEVAEPVEPETAEPVVETTEAVTETPEPLEEVVPDLVEVPLPEVALAVPESRPVVEEPKPAKPVEVKKPAKKTPKKAAKKPAPPPQNASRKSAENAPRTAAPKPNQGSSGSSVSPARWQSRVNAHLNRHKRSANGSGTVSVRFSINPGGSVTSASISRSSGNPALDQAALDLVRRASPVPAPPPSIARSRMTLTVPVNFR